MAASLNDILLLVATVVVAAILTAPSISTASKLAVPLTSILPSKSMSPPTIKSSVIWASSVENKCSALTIPLAVMCPDMNVSLANCAIDPETTTFFHVAILFLYFLLY